MRTSYSAIETYLQCPQRFKFQEIDRIRVPKSREALFGTLIHGTLKFMFERNPLFPTLDEVVGHFREHWPTKEVLLKESQHDTLKHSWSDEEEKAYFEEGVRMLKKFYEKNAPWNFTILDLESRFEVSLLDEKTGTTHILAGIIDRIDKLPDDTYEIIDYKTSRRMPSQAALEQNLQLTLYSIGIQKRWPHLKTEDIKLSLYFLKHGEKLSTQATSLTAENIKEKILATISQIEQHRTSGKDFEPMPGPLCNWCGYRPLCPAWKHLYRNQESAIKNQEEIDQTISEYLALKERDKKNTKRMAELQEAIKSYMERERLTRVFGDEGVISKKTVQRFEYNLDAMKELLSPLGKWDSILKPDDIKLRRVLKEIPEELRTAVEGTRTVSKEYTVISVSLKGSKETAVESEDGDR